MPEKFDVNAEIGFEAQVASTGGIAQKVTLKFPTDEQWIARQRTRKVIIRNLGRGMKETIPPPPGEADIKLYEMIALNGAPQMTAAEASKVIEALALCDVTDVTLEGNEAKVEMQILTGPVIHTLRTPSADQVLSFQGAAFKMYDLPYNKQELRISPEPGARLYDECGGKSDGYVGIIPVLHKDHAVRSVIDYVERTMGPKRGEQNF